MQALQKQEFSADFPGTIAYAIRIFVFERYRTRFTTEGITAYSIIVDTELG